MRERGTVSQNRPKRRGAVPALVLALAVGGMVAPAPAASANDAALGAGAAVCSLVYAPTKLAFAGVGSVVSGLAWMMTGFDSDVARPIFYSAVRGDYVVTPAHLEGRRPLEFVGRDPRDDPPARPEAW